MSCILQIPEFADMLLNSAPPGSSSITRRTAVLALKFPEGVLPNSEGKTSSVFLFRIMFVVGLHISAIN